MLTGLLMANPLPATAVRCRAENCVAAPQEQRKEIGNKT
jgi:hypothetical protein